MFQVLSGSSSIPFQLASQSPSICILHSSNVLLAHYTICSTTVNTIPLYGNNWGSADQWVIIPILITADWCLLLTSPFLTALCKHQLPQYESEWGTINAVAGRKTTSPLLPLLSILAKEFTVSFHCSFWSRASEHQGWVSHTVCTPGPKGCLESGSSCPLISQCCRIS